MSTRSKVAVVVVVGGDGVVSCTGLKKQCYIMNNGKRWWDDIVDAGDDDAAVVLSSPVGSGVASAGRRPKQERSVSNVQGEEPKLPKLCGVRETGKDSEQAEVDDAEENVARASRGERGLWWAPEREDSGTNWENSACTKRRLSTGEWRWMGDGEGVSAVAVASRRRGEGARQPPDYKREGDTQSSALNVSANPEYMGLVPDSAEEREAAYIGRSRCLECAVTRVWCYELAVVNKCRGERKERGRAISAVLWQVVMKNKGRSIDIADDAGYYRFRIIARGDTRLPATTLAPGFSVEQLATAEATAWALKLGRVCGRRKRWTERWGWGVGDRSRVQRKGRGKTSYRRRVVYGGDGAEGHETRDRDNECRRNNMSARMNELSLADGDANEYNSAVLDMLSQLKEWGKQVWELWMNQRCYKKAIRAQQNCK
ncbi:hypothetical protein R3P38DRAFT_2770987 [Favolaschia claudopus]|uniref:Uncharacterized protein n=1 Tax=Favolaschia claudopus TaxID=2862362 RepID=A0AAW0CDC7_9AGAR